MVVATFRTHSNYRYLMELAVQIRLIIFNTDAKYYLGDQHYAGNERRSLIIFIFTMH